MLNKVLWTIDTELDGATFERLCVDLLYRNGYREIVPIEPQDGGRDAEEFARQGRGRAGEAAFFQFSLVDDWRNKVRRTARRLNERGYEFSTLVFVTGQKARGLDRDTLQKEFRETYGWDLIVYSREWLRLQLEEAHPDLAKKYLSVDVSTQSQHLSTLVHFSKPANSRLSDAWKAFEGGLYERAAVELKDFLDEQPEDAQGWRALAWAQYQIHRYDEALASINLAIKLQEHAQATSVRGCILAEKGIRENDKSSIAEAQRLFEQLLESDDASWHTFYNLGNVLAALGDHNAAIVRFCKALEGKPHEPMILKNLASAYHSVGKHAEAMECFDTVLEIDPTQPEALVSKGISLLSDFGESEEAAALLERALLHNRDWAVQWPHIWYWLGKAYHTSGRGRQALEHVEEGLAHQPGYVALRTLKSDLLEELVARHSDTVQEARRFWREELCNEPLDYSTRSRLARLETQQGNSPAAWALLNECFELLDVSPVLPLEGSAFDIEECIIALRCLPQYQSFRERYPISAYWVCEDALYDLPFGPPPSDELQAALTAYLVVPFGLGVNNLEEASTDRESSECLTHLFESAGSRIEHALVEGARQLGDLIPPRAKSPDVVAEKLTEAIMFLGLIALREFGRQQGWIATQFRISSEALDRAFDCCDVSKIQANVMTKVIITLNEEAGFAPD